MVKLFRYFLVAVAVLLLAGCTSTKPWTTPPKLEVTCGGRKVSMNPGDGGWSSKAGGVDICGSYPTEPGVRDRLARFAAEEGDTLTLSFSIVPDDLSVTLYFDVPDPEGQDSVRLYDGKPDSAETKIILPDNCGGVCSVFAKWDPSERGEGSGRYGFLIVPQERPTSS